MLTWKQMVGDAVNHEWKNEQVRLRLGEDVNSLFLEPCYMMYDTSAQAHRDILAFAERLRGVADEIEAALASAPKGMIVEDVKVARRHGPRHMGSGSGSCGRVLVLK